MKAVKQDCADYLLQNAFIELITGILCPFLSVLSSKRFINKLERFQKRVTRMIQDLENCPIMKDLEFHSVYFYQEKLQQ